MPRSCAISTCKNRMIVQQQGITFHSFPKNDIGKKLWETILDGKIKKTPSTVGIVICSEHFLEKDIDRSGKRVRLRHCAVPYIKEDKVVDHEYALPSSSIELKQKFAEQTEVMGSMQEKLNRLEKRLKCTKASESRFKNNLVKAKARIQSSDRTIQDLKKKLKQFDGIPVELLRKDGKEYDEKKKDMALKIHSYGTIVYQFMRNQVGLNLPHLRTLARWLQNSGGQSEMSSPGLERPEDTENHRDVKGLEQKPGSSSIDDDGSSGVSTAQPSNEISIDDIIKVVNAAVPES